MECIRVRGRSPSEMIRLKAVKMLLMFSKLLLFVNSLKPKLFQFSLKSFDRKASPFHSCILPLLLNDFNTEQFLLNTSSPNTDLFLTLLPA